MKVYNTTAGVVIENDGTFYSIDVKWDTLINDDDILNKTTAAIQTAQAQKSLPGMLLPVIGQQQELWACGVTYYRSMVAMP